MRSPPVSRIGARSNLNEPCVSSKETYVHSTIPPAYSLEAEKTGEGGGGGQKEGMHSLAPKEPSTWIPSKGTFHNKTESYLAEPLFESVPVVQPRVNPLQCVGGDNAGQGLMAGWRKVVGDEMNAAQDGGSVGDVRVGGFGVGSGKGGLGGGSSPQDICH